MAASVPFAAPADLRLYVAGYPSRDGMALRVENLSNGIALSLQLREEPHERWVLSDFSVPPSWRGKMIRIVAEDHNTGPGGWVGFSEPLIGPNGVSGFADARALLLRTLLHFVLTMLPCFALSALVIYRGVRDVVMAGAVALAANGASGYLVFWLWFIWPRLGHLVAFLLPLASAVCLIWYSKRLNAEGRSILRALLKPALLSGATALLVLSTGFAYGGFETPLATPWTRFSHLLPPDDEIPYLFAEMVRYGHVPKPMFGDWRSSDRPPLQSGIVLSQHPYTVGPRSLGYEILSANLQSLWVFGLWLVLIAFGTDERAAALALAVCLFSGFVFVNTFFVWPKLLAAAYSLGLFAILLSKRGADLLRSGRLVVMTAGALLAFALLAHGGAVFAILALPLTLLALRRRIPAKQLAVMAATSLVLYLPWLLYQNLFDPPGDRLLKYHLAGVENVDPRPFWQVLTAAYRNLSFEQILDYKCANIRPVGGHQIEYWRAIAALFSSWWKHDAASSVMVAQATWRLRADEFFFFVPCLGVLVIGIPALIIGVNKTRRSREWRTAAVMWLSIVFTAIIWCILMFGPSTTIIHQGSYMMVLLGFTACVLALWAASPWLAYVAGALQIALNFVLYVLLMRDTTAAGFLRESQLQYAIAAVALLSLGVVIFLLRSVARQPKPQASASS